MELEGQVTNVTAFGAFVDVGVHQDGLVHVSQLADRFVKDPSEVVKVGDRLRVRVLEVDLERQRISLTARKDGGARSGVAGASGGDAAQGRAGGKGAGGGRGSGRGQAPRRGGGDQGGGKQPRSSFSHNPFAAHFKR